MLFMPMHFTWAWMKYSSSPTEDCPRCKESNQAELFAKQVNDLHRHLVDERKVEMFMGRPAAGRQGDGILAVGGRDQRHRAGGRLDSQGHRPVRLALRETNGIQVDSVSALQAGFRVWPAGLARAGRHSLRLLVFRHRRNRPADGRLPEHDVGPGAARCPWIHLFPRKWRPSDSVPVLSLSKGPTRLQNPPKPSTGPAFAGPTGQGRADAAKPAADVVGDAEREIQDRDSRPGLVVTGHLPKSNLDDHRDRGRALAARVCVDKESGKILHDVEVFRPENAPAQQRLQLLRLAHAP